MLSLGFPLCFFENIFLNEFQMQDCIPETQTLQSTPILAYIWLSYGICHMLQFCHIWQKWPKNDINVAMVSILHDLSSKNSNPTSPPKHQTKPLHTTCCTIPEDGVPSEGSDWLIRQTEDHAVQHTSAPDENGRQQALPQATPRKKHLSTWRSE